MNEPSETPPNPETDAPKAALDPEGDAVILAKTMFGEARGELPGGIAAVGCVVRNRVTIDLHSDGKDDWWGEGYRGVCLRPWQFSCWLITDPNFALLSKLTPDSPELQGFIKLAKQIIIGAVPDVTLRATHYHAAGMPVPASWGKVPPKPHIQIGRHLFYDLYRK